MKLIVQRYQLEIIPENPTDEAYLEEVLLLSKNGDQAIASRQDASGLSCWGHLRITSTSYDG